MALFLDGATRWRRLTLLRFGHIEQFGLIKTQSISAHNGRVCLWSQYRPSQGLSNYPKFPKKWEVSITRPTRGWTPFRAGNDILPDYPSVNLVSFYAAGLDIFWRVGQGEIVDSNQFNYSDFYQFYHAIPFYMIWVPLMPVAIALLRRKIRNGAAAKSSGFPLD